MLHVKIRGAWLGDEAITRYKHIEKLGVACG